MDSRFPKKERMMMSLLTDDELRSWVRDLHNELVKVDAGIWLERFERTIALQPNQVFRHILGSLLTAMALGNSLSKAISLHPEAFDEEFQTVIRNGEMQGSLQLQLRRYLETPEDMIQSFEVTQVP
jgi:type II secretory pathway component PulF